MSRSRTTTISAVLIVKDEEDVLEESLAALSWVDQVVVYDTGSTDTTLAIAARHAHTVVEGYWDDDFGAARNRAIQHATGEWILVVDADEVFQGDGDQVRALLAGGSATLWTIPVEDAAGPQSQLDGPTVTVRVFPRGRYRYAGRLHEQVVPVVAGARNTIAALPNVRIVHSGYTDAAVERHDKRARNLILARRDLEEAVRDGLEPVRLDVMRANLARSLIMATEIAEGLELAEEIVARGLAPDGTLTQLAASAVKAACWLEDDAAIERWVAVWKDADYSPVRAMAAHVRIKQLQGDRAGALDLLEQLPTTTVDSARRRFVKHELADVAVWALAGERRLSDALKAATDAARAGYTSVKPDDLVRIADRLGRPLATLVEAIQPRAWREYALSCVRDASPRARLFLQAMLERRPGDTTVLLCAATLHHVMSLEELAVWSAAARRAGLAERCLLVQASADVARSARERALAAAMAFDIYRDDRALPALEAALAEVPVEDEATLLLELDIVAPGLVTPAAV